MIQKMPENYQKIFQEAKESLSFKESLYHQIDSNQSVEDSSQTKKKSNLKNLKKKREQFSTLPIKKSDLMRRDQLKRLDFATTVDQNVQQILGRRHQRELLQKMAIQRVPAITSLSQIGTLCSFELVKQQIQQKERTMAHLIGKERIQLIKEDRSMNFKSLLQNNYDEKIKFLSSRLEDLRSVQIYSQYSQKNIDYYLKELELLTEKADSVNYEEMIDIFYESELKLIQYQPRSEYLAQTLPKYVLDNIKITEDKLKRLNKETKMKLPELPEVDPISKLEVIMALMSYKQIIPYQVAQFLLELEDQSLKAEFVLQIVERFEADYIKNWKKMEERSQKAQTDEQAKGQIDELYGYLKKLQEESQSPIKKVIFKKVTKALEEKSYPKEIKETITEELQKFQELSENSSDFQSTKDFLELIAEMPYGKFSQDNYDIDHASQIMEDEHYGMDKVKERILEFIAVSSLKKSVKGRNVLLVGPPGVGKTSVASSIAKCLNREFVRISMGGESDVALLKGHRKTYIGAYPGKLVKALKQAQTENPVILLDEVDKISQGHRGNLQDILLEVLDPKQNNSFRDHFLEVPLDLSKVLFICSANLLETISAPVLDRCEVIEVGGYTTEEKVQIFKKHLLKNNLKDTGLDQKYDVFLSDETIRKIILGYAREAGVRALNKQIRRLCEGLCYKICSNEAADYIQANVQNQSEKSQLEQIVIDHEKGHLKDLLGLPIFSSKRLYENKMEEGVSIGLGYNSLGGSVLYIETLSNTISSEHSSKEKSENDNQTQEVVISSSEKDSKKKQGQMTLTGSLGDVMKESVSIAHTFAKSLTYSIFDNTFLEDNDVHIHFPEGASKKDGPSAGITITTALVSLATNTPISDKVGMTGEISLNGKIMKIGGLREKILAAKREGLDTLVVPFSNKSEVEEMKDYVKQGVSFHFVKTYEEVINIVFPSLAK